MCVCDQVMRPSSLAWHHADMVELITYPDIAELLHPANGWSKVVRSKVVRVSEQEVREGAIGRKGDGVRAANWDRKLKLPQPLLPPCSPK